MDWRCDFQRVDLYLGLGLALVLGASLGGCSRPAKEVAENHPTTEQIREKAAAWKKTQLVQRPKVFNDFAGPREASLQETAADSLARIGEPAIPSLIKLLSHERAAVREQAARALARLGPLADRALPNLIDALHDEDESVRRAAVRALGQLGPQATGAIEPLIQVLTEEAESRS